MYLVLVEKSGAEDGLQSVEIMFYNSFLSLPFLLFLIIATGEFPNSLSILFAKVRILIGFLCIFQILCSCVKLNNSLANISACKSSPFVFSCFEKY